jgi:hypothetical protein
VPQPQKLNPTTWERYRGASLLVPYRHRVGTAGASRARCRKSLKSALPTAPSGPRVPQLRGIG